jgi:hypothetical protein
MNAQLITKNSLAYTMATDKPAVTGLLRKHGVNVSDSESNTKVIGFAIRTCGAKPTFKKDLSQLLSKKACEAGEKYQSFTGFVGFVADSSDFGFTGVDDFQSFLVLGRKKNKEAPEVRRQPIGVLSANESKTADIRNTGSPTVGGRLNSSNTASGNTASNDGSNSRGSKTGNFFSNLGSWVKQNLLTEQNIQTGVDLGLTSLNNKLQNKANKEQQQAAEIAARQAEIERDLRKNQPGAMAGGNKTVTYVLIGVGVLMVGTLIYMVAKKK